MERVERKPFKILKKAGIFSGGLLLGTMVSFGPAYTVADKSGLFDDKALARAPSCLDNLEGKLDPACETCPAQAPGPSEFILAAGETVNVAGVKLSLAEGGIINATVPGGSSVSHEAVTIRPTDNPTRTYRARIGERLPIENATAYEVTLSAVCFTPQFPE